MTTETTPPTDKQIRTTYSPGRADLASNEPPTAFAIARALRSLADTARFEVETSAGSDDDSLRAETVVATALDAAAAIAGLIGWAQQMRRAQNGATAAGNGEAATA